MYRPRLLIASLAAVGLTLPGVGRAQEITPAGPLKGACIAINAGYSVPARLEWAYWVGTGVVAQGTQRGFARASPFGSAGAEVTAAVTEYVGFPAPRSTRPGRPWHGRAWAELRLGPWVQAETRTGGAVVEGGLTAHLGTVNDSISTFAMPAGMFDVRIGGGYGAFPDGRSPDVSVSVGWGYRAVFDRWTSGWACDPPPAPPTLADATLVRLMTTYRRATAIPAWEAVVGIELTPTLALIPARLRHRRERRSLP